jgi:hypothetical protein
MRLRTYLSRRRMTAGAIALALALPAAGLLAAPADALSASACNPTPQTPSSFCMIAAMNVTNAGGSATTLAAERVNLDLSWTNTSTGLAEDKDRWLESVGFSLGSGALSGPVVTPGSELPAGLLISGSPTSNDTCVPGDDNSFSACTAGHGTAQIEVSGTLIADGVVDATFGIHRIENVVPTDSAVLADYLLTIQLYVPAALLIDGIDITTTTHLLVMKGANNSAVASLGVAGNATDPFIPSRAFDFSLTDIDLRINRQSAMKSDGTATTSTYDLVRLIDTCESNTAAMSATDRADTALNVPLNFTTTGCPTLPGEITASGQLPNYAVFDTDPAVVGGRPLAAKPYLWDFGGGLVAASAGPGRGQLFPDSEPRQVSLTVVDVAGARSFPVTYRIEGSTLTLEPALITMTYGTAASVHGILRDFETGSPLEDELIAIKTCGGSKVVQQIGSGSTSFADGTSGEYSISIHPSKPGKYCARFLGAVDRLGVESAQIQVNLRFAVSLNASTSTIRDGGVVRLFGKVGPVLPGQEVLIQRFVSGSWTTIAKKVLNDASAYSYRTVINGRTGSVSKFRVVKQESNGFLKGVSQVRKVQITSN